MNYNYFGTIIGSLIGIIGAIAGIAMAYKKCNTENLKKLGLKSAMILLAGVTAFLLLLFFLPKPYNFFMWIPYIIFLSISILVIIKKTKKIKKD